MDLIILLLIIVLSIIFIYLLCSLIYLYYAKNKINMLINTIKDNINSLVKELEKKDIKELKKVIKKYDKTQEFKEMIDYYYILEKEISNVNVKKIKDMKKILDENIYTYNDYVLRYISIGHFALSNIIFIIFRFPTFYLFRR